MIVCKDYKFIYLANPKTGSTSIRKMLSPVNDHDLVEQITKDKNPHIPYNTIIKEAKSMGVDISEYFVFTTVINPWKKMVSNFLYRKDDANGRPWYHYHYDKSTAGEYSFFQYMDHILGYKNTTLSSYWSGCGCPNLKNFTQDSDAKVYKIENFSVDTLFTDIYNATGFKLQNILDNHHLPMLNITDPEKTKNYKEYYTEQWMVDKVAEIYKSDIEYGEYTFS
jgi:hypothetical protein